MIIAVESSNPAILLLTLRIFKNLGQTKLITSNDMFKEIIDDESFIDDVEVLFTDLSPDELFVRNKEVFTEDYIVYDMKDYIPPVIDGMIVLDDFSPEMDMNEIKELFEDVEDNITFELVESIGVIDMLLNKVKCKVSGNSLDKYTQDCIQAKSLVTVKDFILKKAVINGFSKFLGLRTKNVQKIIETEVGDD